MTVRPRERRVLVKQQNMTHRSGESRTCIYKYMYKVHSIMCFITIFTQKYPRKS